MNNLIIFQDAPRIVLRRLMVRINYRGKLIDHIYYEIITNGNVFVINNNEGYPYLCRIPLNEIYHSFINEINEQIDDLVKIEHISIVEL